jgi:hypothetical protein
MRSPKFCRSAQPAQEEDPKRYVSSTGMSDVEHWTCSTDAVSPLFRYVAPHRSARAEAMAYPVVLPRKGARHTRSSGSVPLDSGSQFAARSNASANSTAGHPRLRSTGCERVPLPHAAIMNIHRHRPAFRSMFCESPFSTAALNCGIFYRSRLWMSKDRPNVGQRQARRSLSGQELEFDVALAFLSRCVPHLGECGGKKHRHH